VQLLDLFEQTLAHKLALRELDGPILALRTLGGMLAPLTAAAHVSASRTISGAPTRTRPAVERHGRDTILLPDEDRAPRAARTNSTNAVVFVFQSLESD
jgi:hypothetical protein